MPDLLLELFSEEIPARMQQRAGDDLKKAITDALVEAGLVYEGAKAFVTPRRLALHVAGIPARSPDVKEEKKGPRVGAPQQAIDGFLRGAGLASLDEAQTVDDRKGAFYLAHIVKPGRAAEEIIAEAVKAAIEGFPWPKSMRWGTGSLRWVRPLHSILCTFGPETEDPIVVPIEVDGIVSGNTTRGHRFMAPDAFTVRRLDDYQTKLEAAKVVLDSERRKAIIETEAKTLAFAQGLELVEDPGLLEEVAGLVEWPVVMMGSFDEAFLAIPDEVTRATIRANQKCFVLRDPATGRLANKFLLTANIVADDGGAAIVAGNERVIRARLSDALYFWQTDQANLPDLGALEASAEKLGLDLKKPLDQRAARLDALGVIFHAKLGTQGERIARIAAFSGTIAGQIGADPDLAERAAKLAKADLQTEVVGEFPELQGFMGARYAQLQGEHPSVVAAIDDHYRPQGPSDSVPADLVAVSVALADKLDTLCGFWAIDEKPTGSKDPYALRRAALGVVRLLVENEITLSLLPLAGKIMGRHVARVALQKAHQKAETARKFFDIGGISEAEFHRYLDEAFGMNAARQVVEQSSGEALKAWIELEQFITDRLKVSLRDEGITHDVVDAAISPAAQATPAPGPSPQGGGEFAPASSPQTSPSWGGRAAGAGGGQASGDILAIVRRAQALSSLLKSDDGQNLLAGYRRAANILAAEEKKGTAIADTVDAALFAQPEEGALHAALQATRATAQDAVAGGDYEAAMQALATLRAPIDAFFEAVLVNTEDEAVRANRLAMLAIVRQAVHGVADLSKIEG